MCRSQEKARSCGLLTSAKAIASRKVITPVGCFGVVGFEVSEGGELEIAVVPESSFSGGSNGCAILLSGSAQPEIAITERTAKKGKNLINITLVSAILSSWIWALCGE
ncbi:unnamed protein product [marine sediment metagenome]|uniref:Uncharacterized protein n=1 Tax=marine sediment metagenome TaxID=412755 RepID=X1V832_9ZZZZ